MFLFAISFLLSAPVISFLSLLIFLFLFWFTLNHACGLLCLVSFILHNVCEFHLPGSMYFVFITKSYCVTLVCHFWFTHSLAVGSWTVKELFLSLLWMIPLWTFPCKSMCRHAFQIFWVYTQKWMTGPYVHSMFNLSKSWQTVFHSSCTIWHYHQQCMSMPIAPHPYQHLLFSFLFTAILVAVKWYLIVVLLCISLMVNDAEHLFMCLAVIYREKCLLKSFACFYFCSFIFKRCICWFYFFGHGGSSILHAGFF